jgi:hypothetical protein
VAKPIVCTDTSTFSTTVTGQYGYATVTTTSSKTYQFQSNWWDAYGGESEAVSGLGFTVNGVSGSSTQNPLGFPSLFIGSYAGHTTTGSNLPKAVSALTSIPTIYHYKDNLSKASHNAAYDVWFTASGAPLSSGASNPGTGGAYLMVWMFDPSNQYPRGTAEYNNHPVGAWGNFNVWLDRTTSPSPPCVTYVAYSPQTTGMEFDLNDFIHDAVTNGYIITNSMYLSIVFGGFEIWSSNSGIELTQLCIDVN